jgi:MscS family membrane protein
MLETLSQLFSQTFLGIALGRFAAAFALLLLTLILKRVLGHLFVTVLFPFACKTDNGYDDLALDSIRKPAEFFVVIAGLFAAVQILQLPPEPVDLPGFAATFLKILVIFDMAWVLFNLVSVLDTFLGTLVSRTESTLDDNLLPFVRKSLRIFIVFMAVLIAIQSLGFSISTLLASLGIGGLAVALAARDTLSNLFGSLMIILDRPFYIGDWVKAGDIEGTVEEVGFRSTKIRTFAKTLVSVPNSTITNLAIDNLSRMPKRRIMLTVGVTYRTTPKEMREAVAAIRAMLGSHPAIDQEFSLVNFTEFGASSLDILVYCFTTTTAWADYLAAREDVCLQIMDILEGMGLEFAFPSRTVYLAGGADRSLSDDGVGSEKLVI